MKFELFIAKRLRKSREGKTGSTSLNFALAGIVMAIVVMILSVAIVLGFKHEVSHKIYELYPHITVRKAGLGIDADYDKVNGHAVLEQVRESSHADAVKSASLVAERPAILKTYDNFKGVSYCGVDANYDWQYLESRLIEGRTPSFADTANLSEVIISKTIANQLRLKLDDRVLTYFIDNEKVKMRKSVVVGIFNTDFDKFDDLVVMGNIALLQKVNGWNADTGNYVALSMKNLDNLEDEAYQFYTELNKPIASIPDAPVLDVQSTENTNQNYFTWLEMLNTNVVVILVLMMIVSGFTLIAALLMIVLERIKMVGLLKALGATDGKIRSIFIMLTLRLMVKALVIGNVVGIGLALIQKYFHVVKLDPDAYYMPFVPIELNVPMLLALNAGILVVAYLTLLLPSMVVSSITPTKTMRFE